MAEKAVDQSERRDNRDRFIHSMVAQPRDVRIALRNMKKEGRKDVGRLIGLMMKEKQKFLRNYPVSDANRWKCNVCGHMPYSSWDVCFICGSAIGIP